MKVLNWAASGQSALGAVARLAVSTAAACRAQAGMRKMRRRRAQSKRQEFQFAGKGDLGAE
jgi:hypothetical protein